MRLTAKNSLSSAASVAALLVVIVAGVLGPSRQAAAAKLVAKSVLRSASAKKAAPAPLLFESNCAAYGDVLDNDVTIKTGKQTVYVGPGIPFNVTTPGVPGTVIPAGTLVNVLSYATQPIGGDYGGPTTMQVTLPGVATAQNNAQRFVHLDSRGAFIANENVMFPAATGLELLLPPFNIGKFHFLNGAVCYFNAILGGVQIQLPTVANPGTAVCFFNTIVNEVAPFQFLFTAHSAKGTLSIGGTGATENVHIVSTIDTEDRDFYDATFILRSGG